MDRHSFICPRYSDRRTVVITQFCMYHFNCCLGGCSGLCRATMDMNFRIRGIRQRRLRGKIDHQQWFARLFFSHCFKWTCCAFSLNDDVRISRDDCFISGHAHHWCHESHSIFGLLPGVLQVRAFHNTHACSNPVSSSARLSRLIIFNVHCGFDRFQRIKGNEWICCVVNETMVLSVCCAHVQSTGVRSDRYCIWHVPFRTQHRMKK